VCVCGLKSLSVKFSHDNFFCTRASEYEKWMKVQEGKD
jgi:hypothetical protein